MLKKPVFEKGKADWLSELRSIIKKYNVTIHHSNGNEPIDASKAVNEKIAFSNLQDEKKRKPKINLGDLGRTADIKKVFSKRDSTNYSYKLYTKT